MNNDLNCEGVFAVESDDILVVSTSHFSLLFSFMRQTTGHTPPPTQKHTSHSCLSPNSISLPLLSMFLFTYNVPNHALVKSILNPEESLLQCGHFLGRGVNDFVTFPKGKKK